MNFNATLVGQIFAFAVFWYFCYKYVWPLIIQTLEDRQTRIADGLAAAEKGVRELELAEKRSIQILHEGKEQFQSFIAQAQKRADEMVDEAKKNAKVEAERIIISARAEIDLERQLVKENMRQKVAKLVILGAEQILMREIDEAAHREVLDNIIASL